MNREKIMEIEKEYLMELLPDIFNTKISKKFTDDNISILCRIYHIYYCGENKTVSDKADKLLDAIDEAYPNNGEYKGFNKWYENNSNNIEDFLETLIETSDNIESDDEVKYTMKCLQLLENIPSEWKSIRDAYDNLMVSLRLIDIEDMLWQSFYNCHYERVDRVFNCSKHHLTIEKIIQTIVEIIDNGNSFLLNRKLMFMLKNLPTDVYAKKIIWKDIKTKHTIGEGMSIILEDNLLKKYYDLGVTKIDIQNLVMIYSNLDFYFKDKLVIELTKLNYANKILNEMNNKDVEVIKSDELYQIQDLLEYDDYELDINNIDSEDIYNIISCCYENDRLSYLEYIFEY